MFHSRFCCCNTSYNYYGLCLILFCTSDGLITLLYLFLGMARGRGHGKFLGRSNPAIHVSMPTIPMPTIVSPNQDGTPIIDASAQNNTPTISETPPVTQNQSNPIAQDMSTQSIPTCHGNLTAEGDISTQSNPTAEGDISTQSNPTGHRNTIAEGDSSSSHTQTHIFLTSAGLVHSLLISS